MTSKFDENLSSLISCLRKGHWGGYWADNGLRFVASSFKAFLGFCSELQFVHFAAGISKTSDVLALS